MILKQNFRWRKCGMRYVIVMVIRLDGLNLEFVKKNWVRIKDDFMAFMKAFHSNGSVLKGLNCTFIALIPKIKNPVSIKNYRPISLVGSIYKVLSKVLANRLKVVMDPVIGPTQMAFVKERQIVDSFVIAEEVIYSWKKNGKGGLLIKLDFEKAYDSIDHSFLIEVLDKMGFGKKWQEWIYWCISSPLVSVLCNGSPIKQFSMENGLRQRDPLSPFLINMVVEILDSMLCRARQLNLISGAVFGDGRIEISHLQFADDTILFFGAQVGLSLEC
ncbi:hypothetical protein Ddye_009882 [Dipteronia dyeriana]|uniref:Reverse transcriptase domain-containing protein n=1 Tax=Dipteronia dyeriana TaxID=168575 RepID=A0AAE0CMM1_9ROSI|nr:hypothetical protein Ddye_009882 [Dipteronia dyeriana]